MKVTLDLTDEQVEWARGHSQRYHPLPACTILRCDIANAIEEAIVAALPQPTLRERAYKVVHGHDALGNAWVARDLDAIKQMAGWLYENAGEREWSVGRGLHGFFAETDTQLKPEYFQNMVAAYAHVVVELGEPHA